MSPLHYKNFGKRGFEHTLQIGAVPVLGIAGPSGVGKSTLIRSLAFLEKELHGELWQQDSLLWRDGVPTESDKFFKVKESFGFIFQDLYLWNHLSVLKNVSLALTAHKKVSPLEADEAAMNLLGKFKLDTYRNRLPTEISGGEAQRLAWARTLALSPSLVFMDEPSSALDTQTRDRCLDSVREMYPDLKYVIVSHDLEWLQATCNDIIILKRNNS